MKDNEALCYLEALLLLPAKALITACKGTHYSPQRSLLLCFNAFKRLYKRGKKKKAGKRADKYAYSFIIGCNILRAEFGDGKDYLSCG